MADSNSTRRHPSFKDLTGKRFGKWMVIAEATNHPSAKPYWLCRCTCGIERPIRGSRLTGNSSYGCNPCRHGMLNTPEYSSWKGMKQRCHNPNSPDFPDYGQDGKVVCERWKSFENFYADMGPKPSASHSVDRIDGSKGYSCGHCEECVANGWTANCKWATKGEQARNTRSNRFITFNGETLCLKDWAAKVGIDSNCLRYRLSKGWSIEKALTTPSQRSKQ